MARRVEVGLWLGETSTAWVKVEGLVVAAAKQEWIDRVRTSAAFPSGALDAALDEAKVRPAEIAALDYAGLVAPVGRVLRAARTLLGRERSGRPAGFRGQRVQATPMPQSVSSVSDLRRRLHEARLPEVTLTAVSRAQLESSFGRGGRLGPSFGGQDAYRALAFARLERERVEDSERTALELAAAGATVAFAHGRMPFDSADIEPRCWLSMTDGVLHRLPLVAPDGVMACSAGEAVRAFQARVLTGGTGRFELVVGPYLAKGADPSPQTLG